MTGRLDFPPALATALALREPLLWLNPSRQGGVDGCADAERGIADAIARFARSRRLLMRLFPESAATGGVIDSPLRPVPRLRQALGYEGLPMGALLVKADHSLPIAGSIKARGGFHEVLAHAEDLALANGLCKAGDDLEVLGSPQARELFASRTIAVGSTGNLGLGIGIMAAALGFEVVVHMSNDAKPWKMDALRRRGVRVVEHAGDYAAAVAAGRRESRTDRASYFVDDENSPLLFMGYAAAAGRLAAQLDAIGRTPSAACPLLVYLPCGVGGAPGGIAFGLDRLFGPHVHCFFAEPVASPCLLAQMVAGPDRPVSVYELGLDNRTDADGLAVPQASPLVASAMQSILSGVFTVTDAQLFAGVLYAWESERIAIEPSAAAGFRGPRWTLDSDAGRQYLAANGLEATVASATHVLWTTGGAQLPEAEHERFRARALQPSTP